MVDKETRERGEEEEEKEEVEVNYASVVFKSKMSGPKGNITYFFKL